MSVETLIEPLVHSPLLPEAIEALETRMREEKSRRQAFYEEMTDAEKVEFIEGEIVLHSPARAVHLEVRANIERLLHLFAAMNQFGAVFGEKCLCVFPRNDYEPDVVWFSPEKAATIEPGTMKFPVPDFVVEVLSESTESRDRGVKFEDYAAHGVSEYWIVDPNAAVIEQYLEKDGSYLLARKVGDGSLDSSAIPGFSLSVRAAFDAEANLAALRALSATKEG